MDKSKTPFDFTTEMGVIACVGDNGGTDNVRIRKGFYDTVDILYKQAKERSMEDIYIYPLFYCARHSVELGIKIIIDGILSIYQLKGEDVHEMIDICTIKKQMHIHNVCELDSIITKILDIDERIEKIYGCFKPYVSVYSVDPDGDAFKYEKDTNGDSIMSARGISSINVDLFMNSYSEANEVLDKVISLIDSLILEYKQKTYTKHLSRAQLKEIAIMLPDFSQWRSDGFCEIKQSIATRFAISKSELSLAIDLIKKHVEFCSHIGLEIQVGDLSEEALAAYKLIIDEPYQDRDKENQKLMPAADGLITLLGELPAYSKRISDLAKPIQDNHILAILTFLEIGQSDDIFSEMYDAIHDHIILQKLNRNWALQKLIKERNFKCVLKGMEKCGQTTYLRILR